MTLDDETTTAAANAAELASPAADGQAADAPPARTRTRRRAASRPAGPPAEGAPATEAAAPAAAGDTTPQLAEQEPAAEAPPAAAPPRKRARRATAKQAAPETAAAATPGTAPEAAPGTAPEAAPEAGAAAPAEEQPEAPAPKRRRARKTAAAPVVEPPADPVAELPATEPVAEPVVEPAALDAPAEPVAEPPAQEPAAEAPASAPAPAVAVPMPIFQAPEPAPAPRTRRRAASRPAGPPQPAVDVDAAAAERLGAESLPASEPAAALEDDQAVDDLALAPVVPDETEIDAAADADVDEAPDEGDEADEDDDDSPEGARRRRRRRGGRGRRSRTKGDDGDDAASGDDEPAGEADASADADDASDEADGDEDDEGGSGASSRRRRRRRRRTGGSEEPAPDDPPNTVVRVRESRRGSGGGSGGDVTSVRGSTRLEAKKMRRREGREAGRRRPLITEAEFLARRESVDRVMVVRERDGRTQIGVLEDGVLVEHYVARRTQTSLAGNVYLGRVQNVLPSMEAAFVDIGKGRNAVLYAGEVNWDAAGLEGQPKRIEHALKAGESVLVQVTKDPIGHKGARLTSQVSLPGRYLVYVPDGSMTGISRKLPDTERARLKKVLRDVVPEQAGVIVRTAAEGASEEELERDVTRLQAQWEDISRKAGAVNAPALLYGEPDLAIRVVRDIFNEDIAKLVVSGDEAWDTLQSYIGHVAPDLVERVERWDGDADGKDVFAAYRIDEQLAKALDRKVWLPSGGSLVIDRTEAMTVVDVNTGKFTGAGGNLEETVTRNNLEAAEEIVRQLRLRDIGGIIVVDFIDMVLESNRELVMRRLLECLGRDRTKHQVAEVTSLGLVQMTRKRVGSGLLEVFSETCEHCGGRGILLHDEPVEKRQQEGPGGGNGGGGRGRASSGSSDAAPAESNGGGNGAGSNGAGNGGGSGRSRRRRGGSAQAATADSA